MIVDCQKCRTRFRLDDARVPATGAKVRCSKCKTAFVVHRPGTKRDDVIDEVVAEATKPGESKAPPPTEDLFESTISRKRIFDKSSPLASPNPIAEASSDEKWEFDEPPQASATSSAPPASALEKAPTSPPAAAAPSPAPAAAAELDALGSPDDWDLLAGTRDGAASARFAAPAPASAAPAATKPAPAPAPAPARLAASARASRSDESRQLGVDDSIAAAIAEQPKSGAEPTPGWLQSASEIGQGAIDSGMWLASVAICAAGLALGLMPPSIGPAILSQPTLPASLGEERLEVTRQLLETGVGERLVVIRGQLPAAPAGGATRVRVAWVGANGAPLSASGAVAGRPLAPRELRENSLERIHAAHEARTGDLEGGGAFEVAFGALPAGAQGIAITREAVPIELPPATQVQVQVESVESGELPRTSSRPTTRPSSE